MLTTYNTHKLNYIYINIYIDLPIFNSRYNKTTVYITSGSPTFNGMTHFEKYLNSGEPQHTNEVFCNFINHYNL